MRIEQKLFLIGAVLLVAFCCLQRNGYASIMTFSSNDFSKLSIAPGQDELPSRSPINPFDTLEEHVPCGQSSINGAPGASIGTVAVSILVANSSFEPVMSHADKVYLRSWMWLPIPPSWELLKIPIAS